MNKCEHHHIIETYIFYGRKSFLCDNCKYVFELNFWSKCVFITHDEKIIYQSEFNFKDKNENDVLEYLFKILENIEFS